MPTTRPDTRDGAYVVRRGRVRNRAGVVVGVPVTALLALLFGGLAARGFAGGPLQPGEVQPPNAVVMTICAVIAAGGLARIVIGARRIWFGDWALAVDRYGVWLPELVPWSEIVELRVGQAGSVRWHVDAASRAVVDAIDAFHRRHDRPGDEPLSTRLAAARLPPDPVLVTVTLRARAASAAMEVTRHLWVAEAQRRTIEPRDRAVADELGALVDDVRAWRTSRPARGPSYQHAYLAGWEIDVERFDAAVRRLAPAVPIRRNDAPADGPAATPVQVAELLADAARIYTSRYDTG